MSNQIVIIAIVSFLLGAAFVEILDPLGPRSYDDCIYKMAKNSGGADIRLAVMACRSRFPRLFDTTELDMLVPEKLKRP